MLNVDGGKYIGVLSFIRKLKSGRIYSMGKIYQCKNRGEGVGIRNVMKFTDG